MLATAPSGLARAPESVSFDRLASYFNHGRSVIASTRRAQKRSIGVTRIAPSAALSAPHVVGVAAMAVGKEGKMHPASLRSRLERSAEDLSQTGNDPVHRAGRVNAMGALR